VNTLIILCSLGLVCLFSEIFNFKKQLLPLVYIALFAGLFFLVKDWNTNHSVFNDMLFLDNYALAFTALILVLSITWFVLSPLYIKDSGHETDLYSLIIFSVIGAMMMVSYSNLIMLFLGLEILSISMYTLSGSRKRSLASNEAALKYFLMGAFATCFLLFGIALIYGQTASFNLTTIANSLSRESGNEPMLVAGILIILAAMLFKVSAAPFHFWAPDVYQGSPTIITAYMSTVVKTAAFAAFLRLFITLFSHLESVWSVSLWVIAAATILVGNITAVFQTNMKRMLAYSSIAHAGYMLLAVLAMNKTSAGSLLFYTIAYSLSSIGAFTILLLVNKALNSESIESFNGLARRNPFLAAVTVVAMLSLAGIPPTAGFFAKYFIFSSAIQHDLTGLVLIAVLGSLIGVFYYFRVIIALFKEKDAVKIPLNRRETTVLIFTSVAALVLGILPGLVAGLL
jgi:NADH-quinone oxidoreductase subunit N